MTGGGAATNSGIDFQHRVGALALVVMLADSVDLDAVGLGEASEKPTQVRFETNDGIDDIVIDLGKGRILVQAKNTLSLSTGAESEFAKLIQQFVTQSLHEANNDRFLLAVSPGASAKIRLDFKKLCESYRLNEIGADKNPLTANELPFQDYSSRHSARHPGNCVRSQQSRKLLCPVVLSHRC